MKVTNGVIAETTSEQGAVPSDAGHDAIAMRYASLWGADGCGAVVLALLFPPFSAGYAFVQSVGIATLAGST